jgi:hypothetical protein
MLSRFFGKRDKSADSPSKEAQKTRAPVAPDRLDAGWGKPERMAGPDSRLPRPDLGEAPVPSKSVRPVFRPPAPVATAPVPRVAPPVPVTAFPADHQIDFVLPTAPSPLNTELTLEQRKNIALATVELHHQRIANTIRTLWGYKECSVYINRLIMSGGDGMGHARVGFNQDAVEAMLALSDIHDAEFGPPDTLGGALGLSI